MLAGGTWHFEQDAVQVILGNLFSLMSVSVYLLGNVIINMSEINVTLISQKKTPHTKQFYTTCENIINNKCMLIVEQTRPSAKPNFTKKR